MKRKSIFDKGIFVVFDSGKEIPEIIYNLGNGTLALEVWPYLRFYFVENDGSRTPRLSSPDLNLKENALEDLLFIERIYENRIGEKRKNKLNKFRIEIEKWIHYIPKEIRETFVNWPYKSIYTWKAIQLSATSLHFSQLTKSNPILAFLIIQKQKWRKNHALIDNKLDDVLLSKQMVLAKLLGFEEQDWTILQKIQSAYFKFNSVKQNFSLLRKILKDQDTLKVIKSIPRFSTDAFLFLEFAFRNNLLNRIRIPFILDLIKLDNISSSASPLNEKIINRFYKSNTKNYEINDIICTWNECVTHNLNWRIESLKSLVSHEETMIENLNALKIEELKKNPELFNPPSVPYEEWNFRESALNATDFIITPITNSYELFFWGKFFQNCIFGYLREIQKEKVFAYVMHLKSNEKYIFSIRNLKMNPTEDLEDNPFKYKDSMSYWFLEQFKGVRNQNPPELVWKNLEEWFKFMNRVRKKN